MDFIIARLDKIINVDKDYEEYVLSAQDFFNWNIYNTFNHSLRVAQTRPECDTALKIAEKDHTRLYTYALNENSDSVEKLPGEILLRAKKDFESNNEILTEMYSKRIAELESFMSCISVASSIDAAVADMAKLSVANHKQYRNYAELFTGIVIRKQHNSRLADARTRAECETSLEVAYEAMHRLYFYSLNKDGNYKPLSSAMLYASVDYGHWAELFRILCEQRVAEIESAVSGIAMASS
jgi:hypothetical protein